MLGVNDFKNEFNNRTSQHITQGIKEHIEIIKSTNFGPKMKEPPPILIVSMPIPVDTTCKDVQSMFKDAKERAQPLANDLKALVNQYDENVYFVDAAPHVQLSPVDGIHFDEKAHEQFALLINETIRKIFNLS
jgi:lysophospholipase L1-like esterase